MQHFLYKMALSDKLAFIKLHVSTFVTILVCSESRSEKGPSGVTRRYSGLLEFEATDILVALKGDCFINHFLKLEQSALVMRKKNGRQEHAQVLTVFRMGWRIGRRSFSKLLLFPREKLTIAVEQGAMSKVYCTQCKAKDTMSMGTQRPTVNTDSSIQRKALG